MGEYREHVKQMRSLLNAFKISDVEVIHDTGRLCTVYVENIMGIDSVMNILSSLNMKPIKKQLANFRKGYYLLYRF